MSGKCICANDLRERVNLEMIGRTRDAVGGFSDTWASFATVWARVQPMSAGERSWRQHIEAKADFKVAIRYRADVTTKHRLRWGNRIMQIRGIINPDERKQFLELTCEELASP